MINFDSKFQRRYQQVRWKIVYGVYEGVQRFALQELQRVAQMQNPYVIAVVKAAADLAQGDEHWLVIGTAADNPLIARLVADGVVSIPSAAQGYTQVRMASPWRPDRRLIVIAGADAAGVLNGVVDFAARDMGVTMTFDEIWDPLDHQSMEMLPDHRRSTSPRIVDRGIWTWGYVLHDYRRFLDNMARLRFNIITIWNDCPPLNIDEVISYAHDRGIRVILGFHWGWGINEFKIDDPEHVAWLESQVLAKYERDYAGLAHDGIYFQTLTEHNDTHLGGVPMAQLVCGMVNRIGRKLLERHPGLWIQFGLHATAIRDQYVHLEPLDPRITITWEDAGVIPYSYPADKVDGRIFSAIRPPFNNVDDTIAYSRSLAAMRGAQEFAIVPKGFTWLRWSTEFENHGPFILGERGRAFIEHRRRERQPTWDVQNGLWMANYPEVLRFFHEVLAVGPRRVTVTALVEDGLFEEMIQPSLALFANMLWDPEADQAWLPRLAYSTYYRLV